MMNVRCKLRKIVHMSDFSWTATVSLSMQCVRQWFVVGEQNEITSFDLVAKMFDGTAFGQWFATKGPVSRCCGTKRPGEVLLR